MEKTDFLSIYYGATDIINVALGYRQNMNSGLTLLGGIRKDFDYLRVLILLKQIMKK